MAENKEQNTNSKIIKKKSHLKSVLYLTLIVILVVVSATIYFKVKQLIGAHEANKIVASTAEEKPKTSEDSINTSILNEYLQKQQDFQKEVSQKILDLSKKINNNAVNSKKGGVNNSKVAELEAEITALNNKKEYISNFSLVYNLISALNGSEPFLNELNVFKHSSLFNKYEKNIAAVNNVAARGITSNYELANNLELLIPKVKIASYKLNNTAWSKIKYYLSFLIIVQKSDNFAESSSSLDSTLYKIKSLLLENNAADALTLANSSNLCNLAPLNSWCQNLNNRVEANNFILKLQQYLLSKQTVENKS